MINNTVYFDNAATTPASPEAKKAVENAMAHFANPSSLHREGFIAEKALEECRDIVASTIDARPSEIVFTSGGTESDNIAVLGAVYARARRGKTIITTDSEHPAVSEPIKKLESEGFNVIRLSTRSGELDPSEICSAATEDVIFASIMRINNETGAVYDVKCAAELIKQRSPGAIIHSDCVQSYLKEKLTVSSAFSYKSVFLDADIISFSAHKIHGIKGTGTLYIKSGTRLVSPVYGGGQEKGIRSGTENTVGIAAFAAAANEGNANLVKNIEHTSELYHYLRTRLGSIEGVIIAEPKNASPYILGFSVPGMKSEVMLHILSDERICVSSGSACSSKKGKSGVLDAFGMKTELSDSYLRISLSHMNTMEEAVFFADTIEKMNKTKWKTRK